MYKKILFLILLSSTLVSCGELLGDDTGANQVLSGSTNLTGGIDSIITENGDYLLDGTANNGGNAGHNFHLNFNLPESEEIEFSFFSSRTLEGGVKLLFKREEQKLNLTISLNGKTHTHELTDFNNIEAVNLDVDIHNDHTDTHILIWDHLGPHGDNEECTFDGGCLYNTEDFAFDAWLGVGRANGVLWGYSGDKELILLLEGPLEALTDV